MANNRRSLFGLALGALALGAGSAAAQQRTTALGRRTQQFYLAKITVSDLVRSYRFYTEVVGLRLATPMMQAPTPNDEERDFRELPLNNEGSLADPIFVLVKRRGVAPIAEHANLTVIGFKVPDARAVLERAAAAGYTAGRRDPNDGPMQFAMIADPDGYMVELIQAPSAPS